MKKILISLTLLLAGSIAGAQPYTGTRAATSGGITLLQANDGTWIHLIGNGVPVLTTFLGDAVPANTLYTNTATGANYFFSSGSWTLSSAGTASAVTPAVTTTTGCTSKFLIADASSLLNCDAAATISVSGAGNGVFNARKTSLAAVGVTTGFLQSTGTFTPQTSGAETDGALFAYLPGDNAAVIYRAAEFRIAIDGAYTGASDTQAIKAVNRSGGTGTSILGADSTAGASFGIYATASTTATVGSKVGVLASAAAGDLNVGLIGAAIVAKNNAQNVGVMGLGVNTGSTPTHVAGYHFISTVQNLDQTTGSTGRVILETALVP